MNTNAFICLTRLLLSRRNSRTMLFNLVIELEQKKLHLPAQKLTKEKLCENLFSMKKSKIVEMEIGKHCTHLMFLSLISSHRNIFP